MRPLMHLCALALLLTLAQLPVHAHPAAEALPPLIDDALPPPARSPDLASAVDDLRGTSQYLAGRVAVRLVLPESDGSAEPESESWTSAEIAHVAGQVQSALDWWEAALPLANLSFALRVDVAPTAYEPINHGLSDEGLWIGDSLRRLGYDSPSYFEQTYAAGDAHRAATGADWTTTIFVVDSSTHPGGHFADGRFAYAYINGPLMVVTSDAGSYGTNRLAPVIAHELGHIFGALDQYAAARIACDRRSGYLNAPTSNSQYNGCGSREPSIMLEPMGAFAAGQVDASARAQVGYRDSDGDGQIDPLDTAPELNLSVVHLASAGDRPILSGSAQDIPYPAPYQQQVTLNTIAGVEYRVNGGAWLLLSPDDGAYDEATESFAAVLALYDGVHEVEVRARNSAGAASLPARHQVTISGLGAQPAYSPAVPPFAAEPTLSLSLAAPADTSMVQVSESSTFAGAPWQPYSAELAYTLEGEDGARTIYVRFRDSAGLDSLPFALPVTLDTCPPTGSATRDPGSPTGIILSAADATTGVAAVEIQVGTSVPNWHPYTSRIDLGAGSEGLPVILRLRDEAGNLSAPFAAPARYQVALPLVVR